MTFTQFGRVELDITKVPSSTIGAKQNASTGAGFQNRLDEAARSYDRDGFDPSEADRIQARHDADTAAEADDRGTTAEDGSRTVDGRDAVDGDARAEDRDRAGEQVGGANVTSDDPNSIEQANVIQQGEGSVRQNAAAKEPGSSLSSSPSLWETLRAEAARDANGNNSGRGLETLSGSAGLGAGAVSGTGAGSGVGGGAGNPAQGQGQGQLQADARMGIDALKSDSGVASKSSSVQQGYRTVSAQAMQAAEAARDSVIKQIAMKLGVDGGEMRVLLDPPQLGRLDMNMVVEKGAVVQISIAAERPEVAMMLDKHMPELRAALAAQGLDLSEAEVHTSLFKQRDNGRDQFGKQSQDQRGPEEEEGWKPASWQRREGWITAEGLDFWV